MIKFDVERLKKERLRQGYSMRSFAEALREYNPKASSMLVHNWEVKKQSPSADYLFIIAKVLKKPPEYFRKD